MAEDVGADVRLLVEDEHARTSQSRDASPLHHRFRKSHQSRSFRLTLSHALQLRTDGFLFERFFILRRERKLLVDRLIRARDLKIHVFFVVFVHAHASSRVKLHIEIVFLIHARLVVIDRHL